MEWEPTARLEVMKNPVPRWFSVAVPKTAEPSRKVTAPAGVFPPCWGLTSTVNTTLSPELICVADVESVVTVAAMPWVTLTATAAEEELESPGLPP
jgi:hypothetical protein